MIAWQEMNFHEFSLSNAVVEVLFGHTAADGHSQTLDDLPSVRPEDVDPHHLQQKRGSTVDGWDWLRIFIKNQDLVRDFLWIF